MCKSGNVSQQWHKTQFHCYGNNGEFTSFQVILTDIDELIKGTSAAHSSPDKKHSHQTFPLTAIWVWICLVTVVVQATKWDSLENGFLLLTWLFVTSKFLGWTSLPQINSETSDDSNGRSNERIVGTPRIWSYLNAQKFFQRHRHLIVLNWAERM